jgi:hypothetical protein
MGDDVTSAWSVTMPAIPLEVVAGEDVVSAFAGAIRRAIAAPQVREVVVVLARRAPGTTGSTMRRLVTTLREIDGVTPIVLPPPRP